MSLWLVRHAQPLIASGICYGRSDVAADPAATQACAQELSKVLPSNLNVISSPLQRCELLTQQICGLRPDLCPINDLRLQEMDFGHWEGRAWTDIAPTELAAWTADFANYRAGGAGESVTQFMTRVGAAFKELNPAKNTLWVTHAGVMRAATLIAQGIQCINRADQWPIDAPSYGQWCKLTI